MEVNRELKIECICLSYFYGMYLEEPIEIYLEYVCRMMYSMCLVLYILEL